MFRIKPILFIFLFSLMFSTFMWIYSFYLYNEDLLSRIIHESTLYGDGALYFPFIKYLSIMDFSNSFDPNIINLKNLSIPYGSLFVHSIFYKVFGLYGLILVNYIAIILFIIIFYKIFNLYFIESVALIASLTLFSIPTILNILSLDSVKYFQVISSDIFTLRAHRPIFISIVFYLFIYIIFLIDHKQEPKLNKKYFFILGLLSGLSFTGFFYYAIIEFLFLFLFLLYKYKKTLITVLIQNKIACFYFITSFFVISLPFLVNLFIFTEQDFLIRNSAFDLTNSKKIILLKYYLTKYMEIKFLFIIFLPIVILFFIKKIDKKKYQLLMIFFLLFISSLIAPIIFVSISNKSALLYHFNNMTLITLFLFIFCFIFSMKDLLIKTFKKKKIIFDIILIFLIAVNFFGIYNKQLKTYKDLINRENRSEFNQIIKKINSTKINLKNSKILTFDNHFQVWLILNNVKYLSINNQLFSAKNDQMIEDDLIQNFKFLDLNNVDFIRYLENKKTSWRIINHNVAKFFYYKYSANSLNTFNDSMNFDKNIIKIIKNTPPTLMQQFAIPKEEFKRLNKKFIISVLSDKYVAPDLVILKKDNFIYQNIDKKNNNFCTLHNGSFYIVYSSIINDNFCKTD